MAASGSGFRAVLPISVGRLSTAFVTAAHISTVPENRARTFLQGEGFFWRGGASNCEKAGWGGWGQDRGRGGGVVANRLDMGRVD